MNTVERKVYFFQLDADGESFLDMIKKVSGLKDEEMYTYDDSKDEQIFVRHSVVKEDMYQFILSRIRMNGLPEIGTKNKRDTRLLEIADDQGLVESTHFIYFSASKILAMEYNYHGPSMSTLRDHINEKLGELRGEPAFLSFRYIFNLQTLKLVSKRAEIEMFDIEVAKDKIGNLAALDEDVYSAFENATNFNDSGSVRMVMKPRPKKKSDKKKELEDNQQEGGSFVERLLGMNEPYQKVFKRLRVRTTNSAGVINLLDSKIVQAVDVIKTGRGREVDSEDMFTKLKIAYQARKDELLKAAEYEKV